MPFGVLFVRRVAVDAIGGFIPLVKTLVPHKDPHSIAQVKKFWRRRIVAGANGVNTRIAHYLELSLHGPSIERGAQEPLGHDAS